IFKPSFTEMGVVSTIDGRVVEVIRKGVGIHVFGHQDWLVLTEAVVVINNGFSRDTIFCGNQYDTKGSPGSINGCSRGIFQYRDALYILRVYRVNITFHPVN